MTANMTTTKKTTGEKARAICAILGADWKAENTHAPVLEWQEITEEQYYEMLNCLPPEAQKSGAFLVGEAMDHHGKRGEARYTCCKTYTLPLKGETRVCESRVYRKASRPITLAEFQEEFGV